MKIRLILTALICSCFGLRSYAADATIANAPGGGITTVPDNYRMPWENPAVQGYYITFGNLTNQVLAGMANQSFANSTASAATNGYLWGALYDPANSAHNATNGFPWGVLYDPANAAHNATNGFPWGVLYDSAGTANTASNAVLSYATGVSNAMMTASNALEVYTTGVSNLVSSGGSATNVPVLLAGTNVLIQVNGLTNTINATINTNVLATTSALNGVSNNVNSAVSYTTGVSNNVQGAITYTTGVSNNVQGAITYTTGVSNLIAGATSNPNALTNYDTRSWTNNTMIAGNGVGLTNLNYQSVGTTNWVDGNGTIVVSNSTLGVALFIAYTNGSTWGYSNKVIGGTYYGDGTGLSNVVARYVSGTLSNTVYGSNVSGTVSAATTTTYVIPLTNGVSVSGTNVIIDMSAANAGSITLTTNAYIIATNSAPMRWYILEVVQSTSLTNTVSFNTNYTMPTVFGQTLTMPTNTANSRQFIYFQGRVSGNTNNFWQTLVP